MRPAEIRLLLTCEHGGNRLPAFVADARPILGPLLDTHRGYDPGALPLARALARSADAPLHAVTVSRLAVDANRSERHPQLHHPAVRALGPEVRRTLVEEVHRPFRARVERAVREAAARSGRVLHVSVHTFTPVLDGRVRETDVGLLCDPARLEERAFCLAGRAVLRRALPGLRIRLNDPYRGVSDGHATALRRAFSGACYWGIELEVNQALLNRRGRFPPELVRAILTWLKRSGQAPGD